MRIGSLCSGYGGLDAGVRSVLGGELAFVADNDPDKSTILAHRYPGVPNLGDLETVDWSAVEPVDVLTAGFPCTDISCAGRREGLRKGNRSGVWHFVARAIAELRPRLVVIENVKELLSERADSDVECCPGCMGDIGPESAMRALGAVLGDLATLGFDAEWTSIPAAAAGACHLRWRVFVLAWPAADADGSRGREVTGGAHGDEGPDAGWPAGHDHCPGSDRADLRPGWGLAADPAGISEREPADETDTITAGRGSRSVPSGGGARASAGGRHTRGVAPNAPGVGRIAHHEPVTVHPDGQAWDGPRPGDRRTADGDGHARGVGNNPPGVGRNSRWPKPAGLVGGPDAPFSGGDAPAGGGSSGDLMLPSAVVTLLPGGGRAPADPESDRLQGLGEQDRRADTTRGGCAARTGTPGGSEAPADTDCGGRGRGAHEPKRGPEWGTAAAWHRPGAFGRYEAAVRRHERVFGRPVPAPVEPGRTGKPRLAPQFSEWMMGLPAGWVTDIPGLNRNAQLAAIGDGVVPQQAALALRVLLDRAPIFILAADQPDTAA